MNIIDISWPITEDITAYKNRRMVKFDYTRNFEEHQVRESIITLGSHSGTHVDAPSHFLPTNNGIETIVLNQLMGPARVIDMMQVCDGITKDDLAVHEIKKDEIILLKTRNSMRHATESFDAEFIFLEKSGAAYLASCGIKCVGIDYLGIERNQLAHETHAALLAHNIPIIEGLRLEHVLPGEYTLICLPLAIVGLEAAPARAILIK